MVSLYKPEAAARICPREILELALTRIVSGKTIDAYHLITYL
jgi:hypothetical protein